MVLSVWSKAASSRSLRTTMSGCRAAPCSFRFDSIESAERKYPMARTATNPRRWRISRAAGGGSALQDPGAGAPCAQAPPTATRNASAVDTTLTLFPHDVADRGGGRSGEIPDGNAVTNQGDGK